jgi:hypothetical protein
MGHYNKSDLTMRVISLDPEKAKTLLVFLTSYCNGDDVFFKGVNAGMKHLSGEIEVAKLEEKASGNS